MSLHSVERVVRDPTLMELLRRRNQPLLVQTLIGGAIVGALTLASVAVAFVLSLGIRALTATSGDASGGTRKLER